MASLGPSPSKSSALSLLVGSSGGHHGRPRPAPAAFSLVSRVLWASFPGPWVLPFLFSFVLRPWTTPDDRPDSNRNRPNLSGEGPSSWPFGRFDGCPPGSHIRQDEWAIPPASSHRIIIKSYPRAPAKRGRIAFEIGPLNRDSPHHPLTPHLIHPRTCRDRSGRRAARHH